MRIVLPFCLDIILFFGKQREMQARGRNWPIFCSSRIVRNGPRLPGVYPMRRLLFPAIALLFFPLSSTLPAKDLPKIAVWDLTPGDIKPAYAQDLTSILGSEISKLGKYEVHSQENVRTLAGWTAERLTLGCTDTKCLTALGQMDIAKLISGRVGKIGNRFSVSLTLFDTQNARVEKMISEFCRSEDDLIELVQAAARKLLGEEIPVPPTQAKAAAPPAPPSTSLPPQKAAQPRTEPTAPQIWKDPATGMEFVYIKGGCFDMGDSFGDGESDEKPIHRVCVNDFFLGRYPVTQQQWEGLMKNNPSHFKNCGVNCPVEGVSWNDVQEFLSRLNARGGLKGRKVRLPTEAEWEYAARSGGKAQKYSGTNSEEELGEYAWHKGNSEDRPHPVGEKKPNELGLHDMSGNVWSWCSDLYGENYYKVSPKDNPEGPATGFHRVLRGGSWLFEPKSARAANRNFEKPSQRRGDFGFRLAF